MKKLALGVAGGLVIGLAVALVAQEQPTVKDEIEVVEKLAAARQQYQASLEALVDYYRRIGDTAKHSWAAQELKDYQSIHKPVYLTYTLFVSNKTWTNEHIAEAETLFKDAKEHKDYPDLFDKKRHLDMAIERFTKLLRQYPTSSRVPEACYLLGEIYEGYYYNDSVRAVKYFDKCYQIDPGTKLPARIKAARIYYNKLKDYDAAIRAYEEVVAHDPSPKAIEEANRALMQLRTTYVPPAVVPEETLP